MKMFRKGMRALTVLLVTFFLSLFMSCGGGGGTPSTPSSGSGGTVSGTAFKGPLGSATISAFAISNGAIGAQIGTGVTAGAHNEGTFSISVGNYSGAVMLVVDGGFYVDEATGRFMSVAQGDVMTCVIPSMSSGAVMGGIQVTPLTSMAQTMAQGMAGGMTPANITAANASVGSYFMVNDILLIPPMDPSTPGSGSGANQNMKNYGMSIAAMSQLAKDFGMPFSSGMVTAMMNDAADGRMDGMKMGSPVMLGGGLPPGTLMPPSAGTNGLANAMTEFIQNPQVNVSGVTLQDMHSLINRLMISNGAIQ